MQILKKIAFPFTCLLIMMVSISLQAQENIFSQTQTFLEECVSNGQVDYNGLARNSSNLDLLVSEIAQYELKGDKSDFPFYLNAYNILVIKGIVDNYPVNSPMDIKGFFDSKPIAVAGQKLTLNDLENKVIRPTYNDARIHFALVCGAIGCPPLTNQAFTPENYDALLTKNTTAALNNPTFIEMDDNQGSLMLSKIFEWYKVDFGGNDAGIIEFINQYRNSPISADTPVSFYEYDWTLNKQ